jgi:hypothetical protein
MTRFILALALSIFSSFASAATRTVYMLQPAGGTYTAFPIDQSLADWTTYDVAGAAGTGANLGRYTFVLDDATATEWVVFSGSSQPASWDLYIGTITLEMCCEEVIAGPIQRSLNSPAQAWAFTLTPDGLVGEISRGASGGASQTFIVDFKRCFASLCRLVGVFT